MSDPPPSTALRAEPAQGDKLIQVSMEEGLPWTALEVAQTGTSPRVQVLTYFLPFAAIDGYERAFKIRAAREYNE